MTAQVSESDALGPLSPELVLVLPPELARQARRALPEYPFVPAKPFPSLAPSGLGLGFVAFSLAYVAVTVGPLVAILLAAPR